MCHIKKITKEFIKVNNSIEFLMNSLKDIDSKTDDLKEWLREIEAESKKFDKFCSVIQSVLWKIKADDDDDLIEVDYT